VEKLYNKVHHSLYCSPNVLTVIKARRVIWVGPVTHIWESMVWIHADQDRDQ